jgi:hypothetical protein
MAHIADFFVQWQKCINRMMYTMTCRLETQPYRPDSKQPNFSPALRMGGTVSFAVLWDRWTNPETGRPVTVLHDHHRDANALKRAVSRLTSNGSDDPLSTMWRQ